MNRPVSHRTALIVLASVVLMWGFTWVVTKTIVKSIPPFWVTSLRCAIGSAVLLVLLAASRQLVLPRSGDIPVILSIALLHLVAFSTLVNFGLQLVPLGRSIVLGYTTPLWVAPGAAIFLGERMSPAQTVGVVLGIAGLAVIFNPAAFDWHDHNALLGNAFLLLAAFSWAANILYVRAHKWVSSPFQLTLWQTLLAGVLASIIALRVDGVPDFEWSPLLAASLGFAGVFGTAFAYWAMAVANRSLPAVTTSLILLATPVVGVLASNIFYAEMISPSLVIAMTMILGGIAIGATGRKREA
jgi:drug/metabolite transporter (DMT)-like permease